MRYTDAMAIPIQKCVLRALLAAAIIAAVGLLAYTIWQPGLNVTDGRNDRRTNGIWIQHGWLGDDAWFDRYDKDRSLFRDASNITALADLLREHGIKYVFPHLCPCKPRGAIASVDDNQTARMLDTFNKTNGYAVLPWVGGALNVHAFPDNPIWRGAFVDSVVALLAQHPRFAGIHVNIEPMPTGHAGFLTLLDELRAVIPPDNLISVAAYPPPTRWHPHDDVHWDEAYYRQVTTRCDQVVPMMYDTALSHAKVYRHLMASWTEEVHSWSNGTQVLLGVPAYDDAEADYHDPSVENLQHALPAIHAGLARFESLPSNYAGIAIYCEWEMNEMKWRMLKESFGRTP